LISSLFLVVLAHPAARRSLTADRLVSFETERQRHGELMTGFIVRQATIDDATAAIAVMRASISELCVADHQRDPAALARWLQNKTNDHFAEWLANPDNHIIVAEEAAGLSGVGSIRRNGTINLCYVAQVGSAAGSAKRCSKRSHCAGDCSRSDSGALPRRARFTSAEATSLQAIQERRSAC
jgi:hypothetical protein